MKPISILDILLYEDDHLLIFNKPPFVSSLDERQGTAASILSIAREYCPTVQLCHRLDKETSGILVAAKDPETYREVSIEFEKRRVRKIYHAVVGGIHRFDELEVDLPIGPAKDGLMRIDFKTGKDAFTILKSLKFFRHFTLVGCFPVTGRTHQIRVHLASQNAPIVNDPAYGGEAPYLHEIKRKYSFGKFEESQPMIKRFALHARSIQFSIFKKEFSFEAPYPKDFDVLIKLLEKYDS